MHRRMWHGFVAGLLLMTAVGCGTQPTTTTGTALVSIPAPKHLAQYLPSNTLLVGRDYLSQWRTEIIWAKDTAPASSTATFWIEMLQRRQHRWTVAYASQWRGAISQHVWMGPQESTGRGSVILRLPPSAPHGEMTFLNFTLTPQSVRHSSTTSGVDGAIVERHHVWQEVFGEDAYQLQWVHGQLQARSLGVLATIPPQAVVRPVYLSRTAFDPSIIGASVVRLNPGQSFAMRPANAEALSAYKAGQLALFGPYPSRSLASPPKMSAAYDVNSLSYRFIHPGAYYLDIVLAPFTTKPGYLIVTVLVGKQAKAPPPPPWIGVFIATDTPAYQQQYGLGTKRGVIIAYVEPQSPAASAHLSVGGVITAINGVPVSTASQLQQLVQQQRVGAQVRLTVVSLHGTTKSVSVTLGAEPNVALTVPSTSTVP